jgi:hypothetical protein
MTTTQKTLAALGILILALFVYVSTQKNPVQDTAPIATSTPTAVTPHGLCGLVITSHNLNAKASVSKPITISGIIDNTNSVANGCSWQMFEGQAGTAEVFAFVQNQWKSISKQTPVPVPNWMTNKTTFTVEIGINTGTMNIVDGTPLKVLFAEDNVSEESPVDTYTFPLISVPVSMQLTLYIQDKAALAADRCDATVKVTFQVPKTTAVADASLALLFAEELAYYGVYKSVRIANGVAQVNLAGNTLPDGRQYSSLSSCESGHLTSVLRDTLTQYNTITSVELYRPAGKIEF